MFNHLKNDLKTNSKTPDSSFINDSNIFSFISWKEIYNNSSNGLCEIWISTKGKKSEIKNFSTYIGYSERNTSYPNNWGPNF